MPKFLISDCDYTLLDFNHEGGITALRDNTEFSSLADPLNNYFLNILEGMRTGNNKLFTEVKPVLEQLAEEIVTGEEILNEAVWSRELWAYHYLSDVPEKERINKAQKAANIYWQGVGKTSSIYEDTPMFVERLKQNNFHIVLVTSSDARLTVDEKTNKFLYDPEEAKRLKRERYGLCGLDKLFDLQKELYIGDPISKPHQVFWEHVLAEVGIEPSDTDHHVVVIGDSHDTDLKGAHWFKSKAILLDRNKKHSGVSELSDADHVAYNLEEALQFIL